MSTLKISAFMLLIAFTMLKCTSNKQNSQTTYSNPVIAGEIPDPSIIRVGELYYATGTSFDFAPNYPIYESTDLINWQQIGSVFSAPPAWASDDFWAPEFYYENGIFYVYYTTKRKDNGVACIGVATTKDIYKGFNDHGIIIEWGEEAIDAFVFKDDDGKKYITWKAYGLTEGREVEILASELSADGLILIGEHFTLTDHNNAWEGAGDEGQVLLKHENYYYLFYSIGGCCDNNCDYRIRVARSKKLQAGWEQYPEPILKGAGEWLCPGHGTVVTTADNRYFYLYHAYNATDFEYVGRQGLLDELVWNEETKWPYFKNGNTPSVEALTPFENTRQLNDTLINSYFASQIQLDLREWDLHFPKPEYSLKQANLSVKPSHSGINFLGFRPINGNYSFESKIVLRSSYGGIGIYSNQHKMLSITANQAGLIIQRIENAHSKILAEICLNNERNVYLKYTVVKGKFLQFYWSNDGSNWEDIVINDEGLIDASYLATWGYSPRAGLIMEGDTSENYNYSECVVHYIR